MLWRSALVSLDVAEAARAAGGWVAAGDPLTPLDGAAIDSRAVRGGELFFALAGSRTDGHRFVADAFARGAAAAAVESVERVRAAAPPDLEAGRAGRALIEVGSTYSALHAIAASVRRRAPRQLAAVTGSVGKTTTKELLAAMLATRYRVARTPGNFNNLYGFPLALLNIPDDTEWMVAELGMSSAGELRELALLARPDVALFTVVRAVHLQFFASLRDIAEAKAELLAGLVPDGLVVANAGDPEVTRIALRHAAATGGRVLWYGIGAATPGFRATPGAKLNGVWARDVRPEPGGGAGSRFRIEAGGASQEVRLPLHGLYNVENCLAAAACAYALGVPLADIAAAVLQARPAPRRGVVHRVERRGGAGGPFTLIDDSYNSNPDALRQALESAAKLPGARRIAVLGDMLELGAEAPSFHREAGERAARLGFAPVAGVGELAGELAAGARSAGAPAVWLAGAAEAAEWADKEVRGGDLVLVKGSRGVGLEAVVARLLGETG